MMKTKLGIYIHIPFCKQKCLYCDFNSSIETYETMKNYTKALIKEIELSGENYKDYLVDSVFIGGGTPSILPLEFLKPIVETIYEKFNIGKDLEFTIEANPNSLNRDKLIFYKNIGINRLSIGAQSFVENELKALGRIHSVYDISNSVNMAKGIGFKNISLDLMIGIPNQNLNTFKFSLEEAIKLDVKHISAYSLILEENTPLYLKKLKGIDLNLPDEDEEREIYKNTISFLEDKDYIQYEISNFSQLGYESKHNLKYWNCDDYLGLGISAHSLIKNKRFNNVEDIKSYIDLISNDKFPIKDINFLKEKDLLNERIIMGFRKIEGFDYKSLNNDFNIDFLKKYKDDINKNLKNGYIKITDDYIKLTKKGLDFANLVELDFYRL